MNSKWVVECMKLQVCKNDCSIPYIYTLSLTYTEQQTVVATEVRRESG